MTEKTEWVMVPREALGLVLDTAMAVHVSNGASSISMPDECVELAAILAGIAAAPTPPAQEAQPVAHRYRDAKGRWRYVQGRPIEHHIMKPEPLYTVPPDAAPSIAARIVEMQYELTRMRLTPPAQGRSQCVGWRPIDHHILKPDAAAPAQRAQEAQPVAEADAHLTNAGMPSASEMLVALEKAWKYLNHPGGATGGDWFAACDAVRGCLEQARAALGRES